MRAAIPSLPAPYLEPELADYPGFQSFSRDQLLIFWSHNVRLRHVEDIASAVRKVAGATAKVRDWSRPQGLTCEVTRG